MTNEIHTTSALKTLVLTLVAMASQVPLIAGVFTWQLHARQHTGLTLVVIVLYEMVVLALAFGKKIWSRLEPEAVEGAANWIKIFVVTLLSGFRRRYKRQIINDHGVFNVRGLGLINTYTLSLDQVFVDLRIHPSNPQKFNRNPIGQSEITGNRPVWDFLQLSQSKSSEATALAIIGPPGSGKTTLLQHIAVTLAANRQRLYRLRAHTPVLLFLRNHIAIITQDAPALGRLIQSHFENKKQYPTLNPPPGWFESHLERGGCMVLLDGLDEVAELQQRRAVSAWVDNQIKNYPRCQFILSARPQGYVDAPLERAHVLEVQPFNSSQVQRFINNWYLANEIISSGNVTNEGVRYRARKDADDLLQRLSKLSALNELTVNPLLLTMIAMVHRYHGALPGSRVELYAEICEVLLGRWRQVRGLQDSLKAAQKLVVLRPLADFMMGQKLRKISTTEAERVIKLPLREVGLGNETAKKFLIDLQASSGLLLEREAGQWSFAHLTFQEYLTAAHWLEHESASHDWAVMVSDSWWHETLLLYAAQGDATSLVRACLDVNSLPALTLAADCLREALKLDPDVRRSAETRIIADLESPDITRRQLAAEVQLSNRLKSLQRITEQDEIDQEYLSCAEYQIFLDEMRQQNEYHQPDHWVGHTFEQGHARVPVNGMRADDAEAFCRWLTQRQGGSLCYRLPHADEAVQFPAQTARLASWCIDEHTSVACLIGLGDIARDELRQQLNAFSDSLPVPTLERVVLQPQSSIFHSQPFHAAVKFFLGRDIDKVVAIDNVYRLALDRSQEQSLDDYHKLGMIMSCDLAQQFIRAVDLARARAPQVDLDLYRDRASALTYETIRARAYKDSQAFANSIYRATVNAQHAETLTDDVVGIFNSISEMLDDSYLPEDQRASYKTFPVDSKTVLLQRAQLLKDVTIAASTLIKSTARRAFRQYIAHLLEYMYCDYERKLFQHKPGEFSRELRQEILESCWWFKMMIAREDGTLSAWEAIRVTRGQTASS